MKVPCEDCIVKAMCIAKLDEKTMIELMCLSDTCPMLKKYLMPIEGKGLHLVDNVEAVLCKNINYNPEPFV